MCKTNCKKEAIWDASFLGLAEPVRIALLQDVCMLFVRQEKVLRIREENISS